MRKITRLAALMTMLLLAFVATGISGAVAQGMDEATPPDTEEASVFDNLSQLDGIQLVITRDFSVDFEAIYNNLATPSEEGEFVAPEMPQGVQYAGVALFKFDNGDHAKDAYDKAIAELDNQSTVTGEDYEEIEIDGFSDNTVALKATDGDETYGITTTVVILTQEDDYLYLGSAAALEDDPTETVKNLVNETRDADAGDGDGEFHEDGTSQGGQWDKLPAADTDLVPEGMIVTDMQLYPETTPESGS